MIIRVFRGEVQPGMQDEFERFIREKAIPEFRAQPGLIAVNIGTPTEQNPDEFLVVTVWNNLEALQAFAGEKWSEAKVAPEEERLLKRTFVHHYEETDPAAAQHVPTVTRPRRARSLAQTRDAHVLLVTSSSIALDGVVGALRARNLRSLVASSSESATRLVARWRPLVSIVAADVEGCEMLLRHLENNDIPIILIGSQAELRLPERIRTLEAGILAPADPAEIAAAADIVVGKLPLEDLPEIVDLGTLRLDITQRVAYVGDGPVELPPKEFAVLVELALHPEQPVSSGELARRVWPENAWTTAEDVRRTVYRLRKLLGDHDRDPPLIRNRRGYGYVLEPSAAGTTTKSDNRDLRAKPSDV